MKRSRRGFVLVTTALSIAVLIGISGLAIDVGRLYIARSEAQAFADAAAISAALQLDGTADGRTAALAAVAASRNRWNWDTENFSSTTVEFGATSTGPWDANPSSMAGRAYVRVNARIPSLRLYFAPALNVRNGSEVAETTVVGATAIAGQVLSGSTVPVIPLSPVSHTDDVTPLTMHNNNPDFGLTVGASYTLKWPGDPYRDAPCAGDQSSTWIRKQDGNSQGNSNGNGNGNRGGDGNSNRWRGFTLTNSTQDMREYILGTDLDFDFPVILGQQIHETGGDHGGARFGMQDRFNEDSNTSARSYADYKAAGNGNGRRLVIAAINTGLMDSAGNSLGANAQIAVGYGVFFLNENSFDPSDHAAWCAEYVGNMPVVGSTKPGVGGSSGGLGLYVVRLVQ
ncbi:MAG: pilus assembly protein TadG-related protein [Bryobacteraceae bacterium]